MARCLDCGGSPEREERAMGFVAGVHLLPSTGEFTYDTVAHQGQRLGGAMAPINTFFAPGGAKTDCSYAIDQLQAAHPECADSVDGMRVVWRQRDRRPLPDLPLDHIYRRGVRAIVGLVMGRRRVDGLRPDARVGRPHSDPGERLELHLWRHAVRSEHRALHSDLKARGFRVIFYPFILMTAPGLPWRGRIGYFAGDVSSAASAAVAAFLGPAATSDFTPDPVNLTVAYSGSPTDYTYRRMILHYAWLVTIAGGVDLFMLGSELRGLESIRGPGSTRRERRTGRASRSGIIRSSPACRRWPAMCARSSTARA